MFKNFKYKKFLSLFTGIFFFPVFFIQAQINIEEPSNSQIQISEFNKIKIEGDCKIILRESTEIKLVIETSSKYLSDISCLTNQDSVLEITVNKDFQKAKIPIIYLNFKTLKEITTSGEVDIDCYTNFSAEYLKIITDYDSHVNLYITSNNLYCQISGFGEVILSGKIYNLFIKTNEEAEVEINLFSHVIVAEITDISSITFKGKTDLLHAIITNDGFLKAFELDAKEAVLNIKNQGAAYIYATDKVEKKINKNSSAIIRGNPKEVIDYNTKR